MKARVLSVLLCTVLCFGQLVPAYAATQAGNAGLSSDSSVTESSFSLPESDLIGSESENEASVVEPEVTESGENDSEKVDSDTEITVPTDDSTEPDKTVPTDDSTEPDKTVPTDDRAEPRIEDSVAEEQENEVTVPATEDTENEIDDENSESEMNDTDVDLESEITIPFSEETENTATDTESASEELVGATVGLGVAKRSPEQIRAYLKNSDISLYAASTYSRKPNTKKGSYDPGRLSDKTLNNAVGFVNFIRYIAGLSYDVVLDKSKIEMIQAASFVSYLNQGLSHGPVCPDGLSDELYLLAYEGCSSSNLHYGGDSIGGSILGYMADNDDTNIGRVGHRRWVLNPDMDRTVAGETYGFHALYAFGSDRNGTETNVSWPAQNMPIEFFSIYHPWSISTGNYEDISKIKVTLKCLSDNSKWTFSEKDQSDGYFNVNNDYCGDIGCIIFRPDNIIYNIDEDYEVTITGTSVGTIHYTVSFFLMDTDKYVAINKATAYTREKSYEYTGSEILPLPTVKLGNRTLTVGDYFGMEHKNNVNVGTATILVYGIGKGKGFTTCTFKIVPSNINKGTAKTKYSTYTYTGKNRQPAMILKVGSKTLVKGRDYTLTYKNNKNVGTATVTAHGIGNYTGTKSCTFKIVSKQQEIIPVYRLFNTRTGEHFYTASKTERQNYLNAGNWNSEGIAWYAPKKSSQPIYRLSNPNNGNEHHYTKSKSEKDWLVSLGWKYDCIAWYSDTNKTVPIYRHYHPTQRTGNHHYTTSKGESNHIVKYEGWRYEGVSFYVSKAGG